MVFSNLFFLYAFLPACLLLYFLLPGMRAKNVCLLIFSLIFYAWGEPVYIALMILAVTVNYFLGLLMEAEPEKKKRTLVFAVVWNVFALGFFKYAGFLTDTVNSVFGTSLAMKKLPLPIGISFYTFQAMSYLIDLYRGKFKAQRSYLAFALYISLYFQLIAGPIVRYETVEKQLTERETSAERLGQGLGRFLLGLGKKVLLANVFGELFAAAWTQGSLTTLSAWLGTLACTLQIYFDFSGYSDMAIGLGKAFGFDFPENFRSPYLADSVTDFWRRWHISLGSWFREYVYIPLGGSRVKRGRHIANILIVWLLTGLWHGAAWNFVVWGLYYALLLILEKYTPVRRLPAILRHVLTLLAVSAGWVVFFAESLPAAGGVLLAMCGCGSPASDTVSLWLLHQYGAWLVLGVLACLPAAGRLREKMLSGQPAMLAVAGTVILLLSTAFLVAQNYNPFLYFRF